MEDLALVRRFGIRRLQNRRLRAVLRVEVHEARKNHPLVENLILAVVNFDLQFLSGRIQRRVDHLDEIIRRRLGRRIRPDAAAGRVHVELLRADCNRLAKRELGRRAGLRRRRQLRTVIAVRRVLDRHDSAVLLSPDNLAAVGRPVVRHRTL